MQNMEHVSQGFAINRRFYYNMDTIIKLVQGLNNGASEQNRERLLIVLDGLTSFMVDESEAKKSSSREHETSEDISTALVLYNPTVAHNVATTLSCIIPYLKKTDEEFMTQAKLDNKWTFGYCYAAETKCLKGLFKFGCTTRSVYKRLKTLSNSSVPEPFTLVACVPTADPFGLEKQIHQHFAHARVRHNREFFKLKRNDVVNFFHKLNGELIAKLSV